ncbi:NADH-quinone oxidoreductase subunit NuoG [Roseibium sediminis]|uniref:NADH-quinone oxidoreductase subunit NuoG n=1 Tax=Roseibium sediminis TaxID=1775174 RepID=UPI00123D65EB|nr:NADH-quinone oxidoreductase subunit NuoG [Roseibium sediminis]
MTKLIIDGNEVDVPADYTLLQACEEAGAEVPRFCYHDRLSIVGNCRMCLVEVKGGPPKPTASCAMSVRDLRPGPNGEPPVVETKSPMVKKAREGVMEFLLINHPLDCPICDQAGECDLQDQAMAYGVDGSRFHENKRAVENKQIGPLIKTIMTRCIHCTRCVRFTTEVAGVTDMGLIGRGEDAEITTYLEAALSSEMQGNVADLCPVGALTHKPYEFHARPWELTKTESIDVMDGLGSAIRVDTRGREVMRVMPRLNEAVNEEWLSDKGRYIYDGLKTQRLDRPYAKKDGKLQPVSWSEAFQIIADKVKATSADKIGALAGQLSGVEDMFALKSLMAKLGVANIDARFPGSPLDPKNGRSSYVFNSTIAGIEEADQIILVGTNPRVEATVLNARIRKRWVQGGLEVIVVGENAELTYETTYAGAGPDSLKALLDGKSDARNPMVIVGQGALNREDGAEILALAAAVAKKRGALREDWNGFNVLHSEAALVGALDIGFVPAEGGKATGAMLEPGSLDVLFLLGVDEVDVPEGAFVIYQGTHGDRGAHRADVILPGAAYTEKSAIYVNTEGRVQLADRAAFPPGEAREDWAILRALSAVLGQTLEFDSLSELRSKLFEAYPHLSSIDMIEAGNVADVEALAANAGKGKASSAGFANIIRDFYLTNPIARASGVMAECSALARSRAAEAAE